VKKFGEFIKETPTNSSGDGGFSGSASSPVAGYDKTLWSYMVTNAYQSPMDLSYRWSNIFPVKKLSLEDIDNMVDASKEFVNYMNRSTLTKKTFKQFQESKEAKKCPDGQYYCFTDKKCKKIPSGYRVGYGGRLAPDPEKKNGNGSNGNGNGSNGNGSNGNGGYSNGGNGGNGGGNGGGGE